MAAASGHNARLLALALALLLAALHLHGVVCDPSHTHFAMVSRNAPSWRPDRGGQGKVSAPSLDTCGCGPAPAPADPLKAASLDKCGCPPAAGAVAGGLPEREPAGAVPGDPGVQGDHHQRPARRDGVVGRPQPLRQLLRRRHVQGLLLRAPAGAAGCNDAEGQHHAHHRVHRLQRLRPRRAQPLRLRRRVPGPSALPRQLQQLLRRGPRPHRPPVLLRARPLQQQLLRRVPGHRRPARPPPLPRPPLQPLRRHGAAAGVRPHRRRALPQQQRLLRQHPGQLREHHGGVPGGGQQPVHRPDPALHLQHVGEPLRGALPQQPPLGMPPLRDRIGGGAHRVRRRRQRHHRTHPALPRLPGARRGAQPRREPAVRPHPRRALRAGQDREAAEPLPLRQLLPLRRPPPLPRARPEQGARRAPQLHPQLPPPAAGARVRPLLRRPAAALPLRAAHPLRPAGLQAAGGGVAFGCGS
ncbi:Os04g0670100 [Oryza sativa Japonica Group]|uniref:Os04g0670100 protein n=1 Tax=Oryza sativa subsp. japonica TaxID=39947 RepID=A0A0P0WG82_ORYSJ|nr:Os04g0670100 [Oryza sativa Japonica Group]